MSSRTKREILRKCVCELAYNFLLRLKCHSIRTFYWFSNVYTKKIFPFVRNVKFWLQNIYDCVKHDDLIKNYHSFESGNPVDY